MTTPSATAGEEREPRSPWPGRILLSLWVLAVLAGGVIQHRQWDSEVRRNRELTTELNRIKRDVATASDARSGYVGALRNFPTGPTFYAGQQVGPGTPVVARRPGTVIVYFVDPGCSACRLNYDSLAALETSFPGAVRIVSFSVDTLRLAEYAQTEKLSMTIVQVTSGQLWKMMPRYGFPLTLLFDHDSLRSITDGRLKGDDLHEIRRVLNTR